MPPQNFIKSSFYRYWRKRERDARRRQSILANSPSKGVSVTTSRTLRVLLYRLPVPVIARHTPFPPSLHPPVFSHLIIDLRGLCVFGPVWEGRGKKLQRRFAGWWPAANKAERRRKAGGEFPATGHETASRSIDAYAVVEARCTHTHTTMHCLQPSKMEHDRNNSRHPRLSNVPSTVRAVYSAKWETSKRFRTRETQRERDLSEKRLRE